MPNVFGLLQSGTTTFTTKAPLVDPRLVRRHRSQFRRDLFPELDRANSFYAPGGRWPAQGWILLRRSDYNQFTNLALGDKRGLYGTDFALQIDDFVHGAVTFQNLTIV